MLRLFSKIQFYPFFPGMGRQLSAHLPRCLQTWIWYVMDAIKRRQEKGRWNHVNGQGSQCTISHHRLYYYQQLTLMLTIFITEFYVMDFLLVICYSFCFRSTFTTQIVTFSRSAKWSGCKFLSIKIYVNFALSKLNDSLFFKFCAILMMKTKFL